MSKERLLRLIPPETPPSYGSSDRLPKQSPRLSYNSLSEYDFGFKSQPWRKEGLCVGMDPDLFFPDQGQPNHQARAICDRCPVVMECLDYAIRNEETFGIWGGLVYDERMDVAYLVNKGKELEEAKTTIRYLKRNRQKGRRIRIELRERAAVI